MPETDAPFRRDRNASFSQQSDSAAEDRRATASQQPTGGGVGDRDVDALLVDDDPRNREFEAARLAGGGDRAGGGTFGEPVELVPLHDDEPASGGTRWQGRRPLLIAVGAAAVLCAGSAVAFGPGIYAVVRERGTTVTPPAQIGDLRRDAGANAQSTADYIRAAVADAADLDTSTGSVYSLPSGTENSVIFAGGTSAIWNPSSTLKNALSVVADDNGAVRNLHAVPTTPLGGTAECGVTKTDDGDMPVCGWADHASVGIALFPNRQLDDAQSVFASLRPAIEHR